ncbi:MAG TPA: glycoside hydrolase family 2 protein [Roseiflexaceae bacterium]|nr:glycoside hydrolase family 2 protein [Roseiflexaceae bacterium]
METLLLNASWEFRRRDSSESLADAFAAVDGWLPATVPGTVHQDLIIHGLLPDPFDGLNEHAVQWVGECDWLYRCVFELTPAMFGAALDLCCDGLDTVATVWLNGSEILRSDNMFVPHRVAIGHVARPGNNELQILFESALRTGRDREAANGQLPVWNGDTSRVYLRKAQYHYGWDWGPVLLTAGPWLPLRIEGYTACITELMCVPTMTEDLQQARIPLVATVVSHADHEQQVTFELFDPANTLMAAATVPLAAGQAVHAFTVDTPQLWWPHGYGEQPLYRIRAVLGQSMAAIERRIGLRRLRLLQEPVAGEAGQTFLFEVNNTPIFCGGANWIPADSFTPRLTSEHYRDLLQQAADMHMVMLRVWGGGIYEHDIFYALCDEIGLLVWQDFMFACGIYPADAAFCESVRAEAEAQVRRLRHHACMALWCGNNEDYQIAESIGAYDQAEAPDAASRFPARVIYEQLLPAVCATLDPTRSYWPGSPYAGTTTADGTIGDRHVWDVWHGMMAPYQEYPRFAGRFVSEFGMQAFPDMATIASFAEPAERHPQSRTLDHHNKAAGGPKRLMSYLVDNLRLPADLAGYIYATQLIQAEALAAAYTGWRRRWGTPGCRAVAGALVWQLNDCWPVTSWAIIDYEHRPKAACPVIRRALAPYAVGMARNGESADVWVVNGTAVSVDASIELRSWTIEGEMVSRDVLAATLPANQVLELGQFGFDPGANLVLAARLLITGEVAARAALWPEPLKYHRLPDPVIVLDLLEDGETLRLRTARPAKGVLLSAGDGVRWSDNMIDLMPDDEQTIRAVGLADQAVDLRWLGRE